MQRFPDHMRGMLAARNKPDCWNKRMAIPKNLQPGYVQRYKSLAGMIETLVLELGNNPDAPRERRVEIMTAITDAVNSLVHDLERFITS